MPSPPLIDVEALVLPIPGDNPAGEPLPFAVREKLDAARKEEEAEDFGPTDPNRPRQSRPPNWAGIIELAQDTLTHTSKDLLVAARLTEALVKVHGFAGLRDALRLLRLLVRDCWDRLQPPLVEGNLEVRAGPFYWLDDPDRGACFPSTLRLLPLVEADGRSVSWVDWRRAQEARGKPVREEFSRAVQATAPETCRTLQEDITASQEELDQLAPCLNERLGPAAPALKELRQALTDCGLLVERVLHEKGMAPTATPEPPPEAPAPESASEPAPEANKVAGGSPRTRAEVYRQLAEAAAILQQLEPHSPVPYLIQRAVQWGSLAFPDLMRELVRDLDVLKEMNRGLGIKPPPEEE